MTTLEGTRLGRYHLQTLLGQGGMSEVYLAYDELMKRDVAVKVLNSVNAIYVARFQREAEAIGRLSHDHILPAFDYGEDGPWHYLVMPYIKGTTLREVLAEGPLSPEEAGEILMQIADALQYAHDQHIIHRDIKPSNILIRDDYHVYLADFGLAKSLQDTHEITLSGVLLGTPEYMAPDLAEGPATVSSDIYALGVLVYQMIVGRVPFVAETPLAVYMRHLHDVPIPPSQLNPQLPCVLDTIVLRALEKEPQRRYKTISAFANAYLRALDSNVETEGLHAQADILHPEERGVLVVAPAQLHLSNRPTLLTERAIEESGLQAGISDTLPVQPVELTPLLRRRRPTRRKETTVVFVIVVGILLIVVLPMSYIYYLYNTVQHPTSDPKTISRYASNAASSMTQPTPDTHKGTGKLLLSDSLTQNSTNHWMQNSTCGFANNGYLVSVPQSDFLQPCPLQASVPSDVKVSVNVTLEAGYDAGLLLNLQGQHFYDFEITSQGQFFFRRHDASGATYIALIPDTACNAINVGQKNALTVIDHSGDFQLYINGTFVGEVHDTTYSDGQLALAAGTLASSNGGAALFVNFSLFQLNQ